MLYVCDSINPKMIADGVNNISIGMASALCSLAKKHEIT
jgi:hypothetical protein